MINKGTLSFFKQYNAIFARNDKKATDAGHLACRPPNKQTEL